MSRPLATPLIPFFFLSILLSPSLSAVISADWQVKDTFLLGQAITLQEFRTTFNDAPHLINAVACPRMECPANVGNPPACDYTNCSGLSPALCGDDVKSACGGGVAWATLVEDVPFHVDLADHPMNTYKQFRFFYNASLPSRPAPPTCQAIRIEVHSLNGDPDLYLSYSPPSATAEHYDLHEGNHISDSLTICPNDLSLPSSTLFISVFSFLLPASYNITVTAVTLPSYESAEPCKCIVNDSECLMDGIPVVGSEPARYTYMPQISSSSAPGVCLIAYFEVNRHVISYVVSQISLSPDLL